MGQVAVTESLKFDDKFTQLPGEGKSDTCTYTAMVQKNSCMFEFPAFLPPTNLGQ